MSLARLAASLLALMICAGVAYAIDPECDPADPAFRAPYDLGSGPMLSPERRIEFCSSLAPQNPHWTGPLTCTLTIGGTPYFETVVEPGLLVTAEPLAADAGPAELACIAPGRDPDGTEVNISSTVVSFNYEPVPVLEPPTLLAPLPPSQP